MCLHKRRPALYIDSALQIEGGSLPVSVLTSLLLGVSLSGNLSSLSIALMRHERACSCWGQARKMKARFACTASCYFIVNSKYLVLTLRGCMWCLPVGHYSGQRQAPSVGALYMVYLFAVKLSSTKNLFCFGDLMVSA